MDNVQQKNSSRERRRFRGRKKIVGTADRPRLVVHRSLRHIEVQIINDQVGHSFVGLSTQSKELKSGGHENRVAQGHSLGKLIAARAKESGIERVVFDRAGLLYHGIVKAVADGAREGGLSF